VGAPHKTIWRTKCGTKAVVTTSSGPSSIFSIATDCGLGIKSLWRREFPHLSRPKLGPTQLLYNGYWVFPRGKDWPGRDPSLPSSAMVKKE